MQGLAVLKQTAEGGDGKAKGGQVFVLDEACSAVCAALGRQFLSGREKVELTAMDRQLRRDVRQARKPLCERWWAD